MSGEDKIIQVLQELSGRVTGLQKGQEELSGRVTELRLHLENVTDKKIQILYEQYIPNAEKLDIATEKIERIELDVDNIKRVVISHSKEINELMKSK